MKSCIKSYTLFELDLENMTTDIYKFDHKCGLSAYVDWLRRNKYRIVKVRPSMKVMRWK